MRRITKLIPGYDPWDCPDYYEFDEPKAAGAIEFFAEYVHHVKGPMAGQPFVLEPWEKAIVANIFGWKDARHNKLRRYREVFVFVPRKNGKTALSAATAFNPASL